MRSPGAWAGSALAFGADPAQSQRRFRFCFEICFVSGNTFETFRVKEILFFFPVTHHVEVVCERCRCRLVCKRATAARLPSTHKASTLLYLKKNLSISISYRYKKKLNLKLLRFWFATETTSRGKGVEGAASATRRFTLSSEPGQGGRDFQVAPHFPRRSASTARPHPKMVGANYNLSVLLLISQNCELHY